jgi:hypothetical protein
VRVDGQAIAIQSEDDAVLTDRGLIPQGAKVQVPWLRGVGA